MIAPWFFIAINFGLGSSQAIAAKCDFSNVASASADFEADEASSLAMRLAYVSVLRLSGLSEELFNQAMSRKLSGYQARYDQHEMDAEKAAKDLIKMGRPAVEALADIAVDGSEGFRVRRTALELLVKQPGADAKLGTLLDESKGRLEDVLHELNLHNADPEMFPAEPFRHKANVGGTMKALTGGMYSEPQVLFNDLLQAVGTLGKGDKRARALLLESFGRLSLIDGGAEHVNFVESALAKIVNLALSWREPETNREVGGLLVSLLARDPERARKLFDRLLDTAGDAEKIGRLKPLDPILSAVRDRVAKDLEQEFAIGVHPGSRFQEMFFLGKVIAFQNRAGMLPENSRWHPNNFLPALVKNSAGRPLTKSEWFFLQVYTDAFYQGNFPPEKTAPGWTAYIAAVEHLAKDATRYEPYDEAKEGADGTIYRALNYAVQGLLKAPAISVNHFQFLKPLTNESQYGFRVSDAAKAVLRPR